MPSNSGQQLPRTFFAIAILESIALAAVVLAYVFDVIDETVFIVAIVAVAMIGGGILAGTIMAHARRRQREARADAPEVQRGASTIDGTAPGAGEGYDPMKKYRSPNE